MKRIFLLCVITLLLASESHARFFFNASAYVSQINKVQPRVLASKSGHYIFKLMPARAVLQNDRVKFTRKTSGTAYKVLENGGFQQLWVIRDLPEVDVRKRNHVGYHLVDDGHTLVVWQTAPSSFDEKVAIRVFNRGSLAHGYAVTDFVSGPIPRLSSGPTPWMRKEDTVINASGNGFSFSTQNKPWSFGFHQKPQLAK